MAKYKALLSKKQFFAFKGTRYKADAGFFSTEDKDLQSFLDSHFAWECIEAPKAEKPVEKKPAKKAAK